MEGAKGRAVKCGHLAVNITTASAVEQHQLNIKNELAYPRIKIIEKSVISIRLNAQVRQGRQSHKRHRLKPRGARSPARLRPISTVVMFEFSSMFCFGLHGQMITMVGSRRG
jgi:hypothetical protein